MPYAITAMIFKILLILILLIAFVPAFRRFLLWFFVGRVLVNEQKKATQKNQKREGEIRVEKQNSPPKDNFKGGEYVDYEEVK